MTVIELTNPVRTESLLGKGFTLSGKSVDEGLGRSTSSYLDLKVAGTRGKRQRESLMIASSGRSLHAHAHSLVATASISESR